MFSQNTNNMLHYKNLFIHSPISRKHFSSYSLLRLFLAVAISRIDQFWWENSQMRTRLTILLPLLTIDRFLCVKIRPSGRLLLVTDAVRCLGLERVDGRGERERERARSISGPLRGFLTRTIAGVVARGAGFA